MVQLAEEAAAEARAVLPDSFLSGLTYSTSGRYTYSFLFVEPGPRSIAVMGPSNEPGKPRWEVRVANLRDQPPPLDVRSLQKTPVALLQSMASVTGAPPTPGSVVAETRDGEVVWNIHADPIYCDFKDASPLFTMTCKDYSQLPSAQELEEMRRAADVAPAGGAGAPDSGQQWGCPFEARVITLDVDKAAITQGRSGGSKTEWFGDCPVFLEARPGGSQITDVNAPCQLVLITKPGSFVSGWESRQFGKCDGVAIFHSTGFPPRAAGP
jgi:hypothetical protein